MVEIYQQLFQSNGYNRNDLMVLFNWGWSRLNSYIQEDYQTDCLTLLRSFPVKLDIPMRSSALVRKWRQNNVKLDLFLKGIFITER